jgi:predicted Zn-dependent protease
MPYTLNGFGTMYYGRRDQSVVQGTCSSCKRLTRLSSYETREWVCAVYIPLIPLKKYRILNDCASCRRHHRIALAEFKQQLENDVTPLRAAVERAPADPEARVRLVESLMGYQMYVEAEAAAREALSSQGGNARLNRLMAQLLALRNDLAGATPFYRQAAALAPRDAEIRFALGRHLLARGESAEAVRELGDAWRLAPDNSQAVYFMAEALCNEKRWGEALDAYQQVALRHPEMAANRDLLRQLRRCKEALGFPLTDAERKAGRRWWPFGGRRSRPRLAGPAATGVSGKRVAALFAIVVIGGAVVTLGLALWKQRHDDLWLDNGLAQPVRITLDGETFSLPPGPPARKTVAPGDHAIVVADLKGRELERYTARIAQLDLFDALAADRFFVYNVAGAHVYQREEIGYAAAAENQTYSRTLVAFERFFEQDDVDFVFAGAPQSIEVDSGSKGEKRVAFNAAKLDANQVAVVLFNEGKVKEAANVLRKALAAQPCSALVRNNLLQVLSAEARHEEAAAEARKWIADCPDSGVEAHRAYQESQLALGHRSDLLTEYQARLAAGPESGANHYLYARLLHDPEQSTPHYLEAIRLQPDLAWGRIGLAYDLLVMERYAEAAEYLEQVLRMPDHDSSIATPYVMAAIGAGSADHAGEVLRSLGGEAEDVDLWQARWLLLLAQGDLEAATKLLKARFRETDRDPEAWRLKTQLLLLKGDDRDLDKALVEGRLRPELAGLAATLRQERALAAGKWKEAVAALDGLKPEEVSDTGRLFAACALLLSGDRANAAQRLANLDGQLARNAQDSAGAAFLAMTRHLQGRASAKAVLAAARQAGFTMLPRAYFVLAAAREAVGDSAGARALYEQSRRTALDFDTPYAAAAARAKQTPGSGS